MFRGIGKTKEVTLTVKKGKVNSKYRPSGILWSIDLLCVETSKVEKGREEETRGCKTKDDTFTKMIKTAE